MNALAHDPKGAQLQPRLRAMIDFAIQLTSAPSARSDEHVAALRSAGLDDRAILDLCQVVAYFNFVNRIAEGLGVELERG